MSTLTWLLLFAGTLMAIAYAAPPLLAGLFIAAGALFLGNMYSTAPAGLMLPLWATYVVVAVLLLVPALRRAVVTGPLFGLFRKVTPRMSRTEQEALDAGSVWWDRELFTGRPDWARMLTLPEPHLSTAEQAFLDGPVEELCRMLDDWEITHDRHDMPEAIWNFIKHEKFFGMIIPKEYGGLEFSAYAHSEVVMKLASRCITAAVSVMVPNSLGPAKLLLHYGTDAQRNHYLPRLARGEEVPCFALTGPDAGSDAARMPDSGVVCRGMWNGEETLGVRLNWEKRYITLGPVATVLGLAFKLYDPDHLIGDDESPGITLALIPTDTPGVRIGERHNPLDIPFQNGPNYGENVFIPMDQIIGGIERVGQGWRMLMECLADGRAISLPALSVGAAKSVSRYTGAYAWIRRQFRLPIARFEGVEEALARIAGRTYQMDSARLMTLGALDCGQSPAVISAIAKYHLTEGYRAVTNDAMDIQGGSGICLGRRNLVAPAYQAIPIAITVEGANILTRSMIIFGQGAIRCHPYVLDELRATQMDDRKAGLRQFDRAITAHAGFFISNAVRSLLLGLTRGRLSPTPVQNVEKRYYQYLNWMSASFALVADAVMLSMGGTLKRKEKISARLGDVLSHLYLASATLKRFHDQGDDPADLSLLRWSMAHSLYQMQLAFDGVLRNLPMRPLAWLLRVLVFPSGMCFGAPSDRQGQRVAQVLLKPSEARERLTRGIFVTRDPRYKAGLLDVALEAAVRAEPAEHKLRTAAHNGQLPGVDGPEVVDQALALGILDEEEAELVKRSDQLRREVVAVDAYATGAFQADDENSEQPYPAAVKNIG